jgi:hypothetical protein
MDDPDEMSVPDRIWGRALWSDDAHLAPGDRAFAPL